MRFFRYGPANVIKRQLDVRDSLPSDTEDKVTPTMEVRAIREFEEFDEGITRWMIALLVGAVAGEFGVIALAPPDFIPVAAPGGALGKGSIVIVDSVLNTSGITVDIGITTLAVAQATLAGISNITANADSRGGPASASVPGVNWMAGTDPAGLSGSDSVTAGTRHPGPAIAILHAGSAHVISFTGAVANTAVGLRIRGRTWRPKD